MPRPGQIIPNYLHPHVMTVINDNTVFQDGVSVPEDAPAVICVFVSGEGEDGKFKRKNSIGEFIEEFGQPNFRTDGQAIYNAMNVLKSGKASVFGMRVMPEDAAYSNIVVLAKVKKDTVANKLIIKHEVVCHTELLDKNSLEALTDGLEAEEDSDGFVTIPLMAFRTLGRGVYGNNFAVRVSPVPQSDKEFGFKSFRVEVLKITNGVVQKEVFEGSLFADAITSAGSKYIEDVFNDVEKGSKFLSTYTNPTALDKIHQLYTQMSPEVPVNAWEFDVLFGNDIKGVAIPMLEITTECNPILSNEGMRLSFGADGSFGTVNSTRAAREDAISIMYQKAFKGEIDRTILSKRRLPTIALLDANYAEEVKRAMVDLVFKRKDCRLYLDSGILSTTAEAIAYGKLIADIDTNYISKGIHSFTTRDPYSGRNMHVTETYFLAKELIKHIGVNGQHIPFTGEKYAKLNDFVAGTVKPVVDVDDLETKEALYELRLNYFEAIGENTFIRSTQATSQSEFSDLSEENNVLTVLKVKRKLENLLYSLTYNFASEEDRNNYTEDAKREVEPMMDRELEEIDVYFQMTQWEAERSVLHCYCAITCKGLTKRGIVEIDINKRV